MQAKLHPHQHGECQHPWVQSLICHAGAFFGGGSMMATRLMPCRTGCEPCLRKYAGRWAFRTRDEIDRGARARFVTLTDRFEVTPRQFYSALRTYERLIRDKEARRAKAEGRAPTKLRRVAVIERGENGTRRIHGHAIYIEDGPPIPRAFYKERSRENPKGCWLHGWVKTKLIRETPLKAARYLTKYLLKNPERFPGGRRLAASPFWGPGKPVFRAVRSGPGPDTTSATVGAWNPPEGGSALGPFHQWSLPSYALLTKPQASPESANGATGPPGPSIDGLRDFICEAEKQQLTVRIIPSNELPPEMGPERPPRYPTWDGSPVSAASRWGRYREHAIQPGRDATRRTRVKRGHTLRDHLTA